MRALIFAVCFLCTASASAQTPDQEAKKLFERGVAAAAVKDYSTAVDSFTKAYALSPRPILLFNLGQAQRLMGATASAVTSYRRYLEAEPAGTYSAEARQWIAELAPVVDAELKKRKQARLKAERKAAAKAARERESGTRKAARNRAIQEREADAARDQQARRELEEAMRLAQDDSTALDGQGSAIGAGPGSSTPGNRRKGRFGTMGYTGVATVGVGLFMTGVSLYFGGLASDSNDLIEGARDQWTDEQLAAFERGEAHDRNAKIFGGFGGSALALGTALVIIDLFWLDNPSAGSLSVTPTWTDSDPGVSLSGSF